MEIGQQGESVEDSILKNLSETRDLWRSQESNQNTKMLQPKSKVIMIAIIMDLRTDPLEQIGPTSLVGTRTTSVLHQYHISTIPVPPRMVFTF